MNFVKNLCAPALINLFIAAIVIIIHIVRLSFVGVIFNVIMSGLCVLLLNFLCNQGLGVVSWIIVALSIPGYLLMLLLSTATVTKTTPTTAPTTPRKKGAAKKPTNN